MNETSSRPTGSLQESALDRFPLELLTECFLWCIAGGLPRYHPSMSPINLTAVCRSWRAVTLSTPRLWSRLRFTASCDDEAQTSEELAKFTLFLDRSGTTPLTYTLILAPHDYTPLSVRAICLRPFLATLVEHATHWSDMIIQSTVFDPMQLLRISDNISLPVLKRLALWKTDFAFSTSVALCRASSFARQHRPVYSQSPQPDTAFVSYAIAPHPGLQSQGLFPFHYL